MKISLTENDLELLGAIPSTRWMDALNRLSVIDGHMRIRSPDADDVARSAQTLGLSVRSFYRLIRDRKDPGTIGEAARSQRGMRRYVSPQIEEVIAETQRAMGAEASDSAVHREVARRCRAMELPPPSYSAVRTRARVGRVNLCVRIGRLCDVVVDTCAMDLDVVSQDTAGSTEVAHLTAVLAARNGDLLAHRVTAGLPTANDVLGVLPAAGSEVISTMLVTGTIAATLAPRADEIENRGLHLDLARSAGLRPGVASIPALGRRIGRIELLPRRETLHDPDDAVPLRLASAVVAMLVANAGRQTEDVQSSEQTGPLLLKTF